MVSIPGNKELQDARNQYKGLYRVHMVIHLSVHCQFIVS